MRIFEPIIRVRDGGVSVRTLAKLWEAWRRRRAVPVFHEELTRALADPVSLRLRADAIERSLIHDEVAGSLQASGRTAGR